MKVFYILYFNINRFIRDFVSVNVSVNITISSKFKIYCYINIQILKHKYITIN